MTKYEDEFFTQMVEAVENNELEFVREQLEADPELIHYHSGVDGFLDAAVDCGHMEMVTMLLDMGCDVNKKGSLGTPLCTAIVSDNPEMVHLLLENGAKILSEERHVLAPVTSQAKNSLAIVKILEQYGADFDEVFENEQNGEAINALFMAALFSHEDVEEYLKAKGCQFPEQREPPERVGIADLIRRAFGKKN